MTEEEQKEIEEFLAGLKTITDNLEENPIAEQWLALYPPDKALMVKGSIVVLEGLTAIDPEFREDVERSGKEAQRYVEAFAQIARPSLVGALLVRAGVEHNDNSARAAVIKGLIAKAVDADGEWSTWLCQVVGMAHQAHSLGIAIDMAHARINERAKAAGQ